MIMWIVVASLTAGLLSIGAVMLGDLWLEFHKGDKKDE